MKKLGAVLVIIGTLAGCAAEDEPQPQEPEQPGNTTSEPAPAPTEQTATAKTDCSVPYSVGSDGRKHYKVECLNP